MAVFGNFLVCFVILVNRHLRYNPTNLFIFSLALSDFLAATIVMAVLLTMAVSSFLNVILPLMITCFFYFLIYRIAVKNNRSTKRGTFPSTWKPFKDEKRCIWEISKRLRRLQCSFWRCSSAGNLTFIFRCYCYRRRKLGIVSSRSFPGTIDVRFEALDLNIVKQPHYK